MACAIPMMSFIGNLAGVTTQAAFVESMIIVFAGGKTGLSAVVTGALYAYVYIQYIYCLYCSHSSRVKYCYANQCTRSDG